MARKSNIFTRILQLVLDVNSVEKTKRATQKALRDATDPKTTETNAKKLEKAFNKLTASAIAFATALIAGVAIGLRKVIQESSESQKVLAQQEAVLRSTGNAAGRTADQLQEQADALQKVTTFTDESITSVQNLLLTFRQLKGDEFDRATRLTLDLATALGTDATSAALQLGKALQDPITGLTALRRAGVSFSASQKQVIKDLVETGKVAEAQRLILAELEVEFGGSAEAARDTLGGALEGLKNAFGELFEVTREESSGMVGLINDIADALPKLDSALKKFLDTDQRIEEWWRRVGRDFLTSTGRFFGRPVPPPRTDAGPGGMDVREKVAQLDRERARLAALAERDRIAALEEQEALNEKLREAEEGRREAAEKAAREEDRILEERIGLLVEARDLGIATAEDEQQLVSLYGAIVRTLQAGNLELEERVRLSKLAASVAESFLGKREVEGPKAGETVGRFPLPDRGGGGLIAAPGQPIVAPDVSALTSPAKETENAWVDALKTVGEEAEITSGLLQAAFDSRGFLAGLAQVASAKVKENIARSIETLAGGLAASVFGDPTKLPIAAKASAGFLAAAAAWGAIGGLAGGGGGGGGAGAAQSARTPAGRGADTVQRQQTITFIVNVDGIDPKNGVHQQKVGDTVGNIIERVGNRITGGGLGGATR